MDARRFWVAFNLVKGIGAVRLRGLLDHFGDLEKAWNASPGALRSAGLSEKIVDRLVQVRSGDRLDLCMERIDSGGIQVVTWDDANYPPRLKEIDQPPPVIYVRGAILPEDDLAVAMVGTRRMTVYGRQICEEVADYLARAGVTIVSGLARGVDGVAHQAAVNAGGRTIAVLGCGVDLIYPHEHKRLAEKIMQQGALVSDYPPGTPPESSNFPPRNRIISGLSLATIVVEAGETSGALITATFAVEQGRDVLAVPGAIHSPQSKGANRLIQQGAHPLIRPQDVLDLLDIQVRGQQITARKILPSDDFEAAILACIGDSPTHLDDIGAMCGLPIEKVSATLTMMELKGMVQQIGGSNYLIMREATSFYGDE